LRTPSLFWRYPEIQMLYRQKRWKRLSKWRIDIDGSLKPPLY